MPNLLPRPFQSSKSLPTLQKRQPLQPLPTSKAPGAPSVMRRRTSQIQQSDWQALGPLSILMTIWHLFRFLISLPGMLRRLPRYLAKRAAITRQPSDPSKSPTNSKPATSTQQQQIPAKMSATLSASKSSPSLTATSSVPVIQQKNWSRWTALVGAPSRATPP